MPKKKCGKGRVVKNESGAKGGYFVLIQKGSEWSITSWHKKKSDARKAMFKEKCR